MRVLVEYETHEHKITLGLRRLLDLLGVEKTEDEIIKALKQAIREA